MATELTATSERGRLAITQGPETVDFTAEINGAASAQARLERTAAGDLRGRGEIVMSSANELLALLGPDISVPLAGTGRADFSVDWGDETIPINADITLGFDITQAFIDYTYYPWVKERWAAGFGLGLRWMDLQVTLAYRDNESDIEEQSDVKGTAPLPYLYFEYRRLFSDHWRFTTGLGWFYLKFNDIEGGQWIGRVGIEYLAGRRWAFGAAVNLSTIDVDWNDVSTEVDDVLNLTAKLDINDLSLFVRVRF